MHWTISIGLHWFGHTLFTKWNDCKLTEDEGMFCTVSSEMRIFNDGVKFISLFRSVFSLLRYFVCCADKNLKCSIPNGRWVVVVLWMSVSLSIHGWYATLTENTTKCGIIYTCTYIHTSIRNELSIVCFFMLEICFMHNNISTFGRWHM